MPKAPIPPSPQTIREAERQRIAQDLHDAFGGNLTAASLLLSQLASHQHSPQQAQTLQLLRQLLNDSKARLQQVIYDLRPPELAAGLVAALRNLCEWWQACSQIECTLSLPEVVDEASFEAELSTSLKLNLYRIVQEGLNNVAKHAQANRAEVVLWPTQTGICLKITDNGKVANKKSQSKHGVGLDSIAQRVAAFGGKVSQQLASEGGYCLICEIPQTQQQVEVVSV